MTAVTLLGTQTFNTTSGTHTVVATPAVGDLIVLVCANTGNTSTAAPTDNNSDGAGVYSLIATAVKASSADTMKFWVRQSRIGSASSTTFTHAPGTSSGGGLGVFKVTSMTRSDLNAIRQSAIQSNQSSGGTPTPVLGQAALTTNSLIGAVFNATNPATMTPRSSPAWTERFDTGYAIPTTGIETMSIDSGETGTSIAWGGTSASAFCSGVVELDASTITTTEAAYRLKTAFKLRRTRFKLRVNPELDQHPATPSVSPDASLDRPFITRITASKRSLRPIWSAAYAPTTPVPVAAWLPAAHALRRRVTRFHLRTVVQPPSAPPTPVIPLYIEKPKVRRIEFRPRLLRAAPQVSFPQTTGPPSPDSTLAVPFLTRRQRSRKLQRPAPQVSFPTPSVSIAPEPAWRAPKRLKFSQVRRLQPLLTLNQYPATPATSPAVLPAYGKPRTFKTRQVGIAIAPPPTILAPVQPQYPSFAPVKTVIKRNKQARKHLRLPPYILASTAAPITSPAVLPAYIAPKKFSTHWTIRLQRVRELGSYPATPAVISADRTLAQPFVTHKTRSRKALRPPAFISASTAAPITYPGVLPAYTKPRAFKTRQTGLALAPPPTILSSVRPPVAAWKEKCPFIRHSHRKLRKALLVPSWPQLATVPNVVGETQAQATTDIHAAGFAVQVSSAYSATVAVGLVISQSPTGGSSAVAGSIVSIVVSLGPATGSHNVRFLSPVGNIMSKDPP